MDQESKHNDPFRAARQFELMFPHASSECLDSRINPPTPVLPHETSKGPLVAVEVTYFDKDGRIEDSEWVFRNSEGKFVTRNRRAIDESAVI